ncbi:MAG: ABC transporter ATP-binding protein [Actinomycetota bacterium]
MSVSTGRAAIRLDRVTVGYGGPPVVRDLGLTVEPGEWLALIGPNGAGKSTVLKALVGVLRHEGTIEIDGATHRGRAGAGRQIGYVPQQPTLPAGMTTAEYVLLGRTAHLGWFGSETAADRHRVGEVLAELGLEDLAGRPVDRLSGGEAQRAALARALVQDTAVLALDEPTSALDLANQVGILELVDRLRRQRGLAVVTAIHDLSTASRFADRVALLDQGTLVAAGTTREVLTEELLTTHYRIPVSVLDGPDGGLVVVPLRAT